MPGMDRTGPSGIGPMTGRGAGHCAGNSAGIYPNCGFGFGRRMGAGRGMARGMARGAGFAIRRNYSQPLTKEGEINSLKDQASFMKTEISSIESRIKDLESE